MKWIPGFNMFLLCLIISVNVLTGCEKEKVNFRKIEFETAPHIKLNIDELKSRKIWIEPDEKSTLVLKVVIYSYSPGKETISMTNDSEFVTDIGSGIVSALVEFIDNGKMIRAEFIEVSGNSKEELFENLYKSVKTVCGY